MAGGGATESTASGAALSWLAAHRRAASDGAKHIVEHRLASALSMALMAIALTLPASLLALLENRHQLAAEWGATPTLSVFLHHEISVETIRQVVEEVSADPGVTAVEWVSSETAFGEFSASVGLTGLLDNEENPLPDVLIVTPTDAIWRVDNGQALNQRLSALAQVDTVIVDFAWVERLNAMGALVSRGLLLLAGGLFVATMLIVANSVQGLISANLREIEVMKLIGATDEYVRRPFLYSGALHGFGAGLLAAVTTWAVVASLIGPLQRLITAHLGLVSLSGPSLVFLLAIIAAGAGIGWCGSWLGTLSSLRQFEPH